MTTGLKARLFLAAVVVLGTFAANSFAADKTRVPELSKALGQAKLFAGLTDKERAALESAATLRHCKEGERIIEQGKTLDRMFIVLESQAEVRVNGKLVATLPEQSLVGEIEFLDRLPASADVVILKESNLIELNNAALASLMTKQPRLGYVLMSEIARIEGQRLRAMDQK
jgi:CRP/FNR family cyclic AMP-dependent transcriptional regulator